MFLKLKELISQIFNFQNAVQRWDFAAADMPLSWEKLGQYQQRVKNISTNIKFALTAPVIWSGLVPALIMDLFVTVYQRVCFPVYGIKKVKRAEYFKYERERLKYLTWLERVNCYYCSYFNGLVAYTREVAARTERFWCPLKHKNRLPNPHNHYHKFANFGDEACFRKHQENESDL